MARSGGQRTAPYRLPLYSPSQYKQLSGCLRRWAWNRILKLAENQGAKAALGSQLHEECERWLKFGILPTSKEARSAIKYGPPPKSCLAEVPVRFDLDGRLDDGLHPWGVDGTSSWVGYIDAVYGWRLDPGPWYPTETDDPRNMRSYGRPAGKAIPLTADVEVVVIHDWKFTSDWQYAMTSEELKEEFAANFYAYEAFEAGAKRVFCRWVYTKFDGQSSREVWAEMDRTLGFRLLSDAADEAVEANEVRADILAGRMSVDDLEADTSHCFDFHSTCPRKGVECHPVKTTAPFAPKRRIEMDSFESETAANFGAKTLPPLPGKKAPPPPPPKAGLPPLPGKKPADVLKPEAGFINPVGGPVSAPNSPEDAVEAGNVHVPEVEAAPEADDLEGKSLAELRAIAAAIGATHAPTARTPGVTAAIRARRAELELAEETGGDFVPDSVFAADEATQAVFQPQIDRIKERVSKLSNSELGEALSAAAIADEYNAPGAAEERNVIEEELATREGHKRVQTDAEFDAEVAATVASQKAAMDAEEAREEPTVETVEEPEETPLEKVGRFMNLTAKLMRCKITLTFDGTAE